MDGPLPASSGQPHLWVATMLDSENVVGTDVGAPGQALKAGMWHAQPGAALPVAPLQGKVTMVLGPPPRRGLCLGLCVPPSLRHKW